MIFKQVLFDDFDSMLLSSLAKIRIKFDFFNNHFYSANEDNFRPWMVFIKIKNAEENKDSVCGGSLITKKIFMP